MNIHAEIQKRAKELIKVLPPYCTAEATRSHDGEAVELRVIYADKEGRKYFVVSEFRDTRDLRLSRQVSLSMVEQMIRAIDEGLPAK